MKSKINFLLITTVAVLLGVHSISAQSLFPVLGTERAGTTSMTFLKIGVGARAEGIAGGFVAVADDPSCLYWNPAGMVRMRGRSGALFNYLQWPADVQYSFLGWVHRFEENQSVGVYLGSLSLPDFEETTVTNPHGTGRYVTYGDFMAGASYGRALTPRFSVGISLKYARETLDDLHINTILGDVGTLYFTGIEDIRLGATLQHFGPNMRPGGTYTDETGNHKYEDYPPPTVFRLGAAGSAFRTDQHALLLAIALEHPVDNAESLSFGAEYTFKNFTAFRVGKKINKGEENWTAGVGVRVPFMGMQIELDFAYTDFGLLDMAQRVSSQMFYGGMNNISY